MRRPPKPTTLAESSQKLTELGFNLSPLQDGKVLVRKYGCAAILAASGESGVEIATAPGMVVGGELARLVDRGYQKFFKTASTEAPALPEQMAALARFENELRYACGIPSLYNESLGSVSDRYLYDRIVDRDEGHQPKAWEHDAAAPLRRV
ncbi:MAG: hypothetical protein ACRD1L_01560 [Terriglobales bacterium]